MQPKLFTVSKAPLQTAACMHAFSIGLRLPERALLGQVRPRERVFVCCRAVAVGQLPSACDRDVGGIGASRAQRVVARPRECRRVEATIEYETRPKIVVCLPQRFAQNDVDRSSNRTRPSFSRWCTENFDAFHLFRSDRFHRESGWNPLPIEQNLREATTHATHGDRAATTGTAALSDTWQTAHHVAEITVAVLFNFFAGDDNFRCCGITTLLCRLVLASNFDGIHALRSCTRGALLVRRRCRLGAGRRRRRGRWRHCRRGNCVLGHGVACKRTRDCYG